MENDVIKIYTERFRQNFDLTALSLYGTDEVLTYGEFAANIAKLHILFNKLGITKGDKIALLGKNTPKWITVFIGTLTYGAVIVPILHDFNPNDATHIVNHSDARLLFVSDSIWDTIEFSDLTQVEAVFSLDDKRIICVKEDKQEIVDIYSHLEADFTAKYPAGFTKNDIAYEHQDKNSVALINYTSGTTGFSKGVMLTYDNLAGNIVFGINEKLYYPGAHCLSFLPLAHAYGCAFDMLLPLAEGSHITIFGKTPAPKLLLKALAEVKPNLVICVPLILEKIYRKQIVPMITKKPMRWVLAIPFLDSVIYSKIRNKLIDAFGGNFEEVIVGGAPINAEVEDFLHKIKFPFTVGYGMTECAPLISYTHYKEFIPTSCGRTLPNMESKIDSPDPENIPGEICVRGQNAMVGYYKNEKATKSVIDSEGWLHTGDMGVRTADGTLFIKGRSKTMILSASGQNIYPEEIESKLNNMPFVSESLVIQKGSGLVALVYPDSEEVDRAGLTDDEFLTKMEENRVELNKIVAPYEKVSAVKIMEEEFEKTPKKSIKRFLYYNA